MLPPIDYGKEAIFNETTRKIMGKIEFTHGGVEYDSKYPEGIPTSMELKTTSVKIFDSVLVMFPGGHARFQDISAKEVLSHKFKLLGKLGLERHELQRFMINLANIGEMTNEDLQDIYDCNIKFAEEPIDDLSH